MWLLLLFPQHEFFCLALCCCYCLFGNCFWEFLTRLLGKGRDLNDLDWPALNSHCLDEAKTGKLLGSSALSLLLNFANTTRLETMRVKEEVPLSSNTQRRRKAGLVNEVSELASPATELPVGSLRVIGMTRG